MVSSVIVVSSFPPHVIIAAIVQIMSINTKKLKFEIWKEIGEMAEYLYNLNGINATIKIFEFH